MLVLRSPLLLQGPSPLGFGPLRPPHNLNGPRLLMLTSNSSSEALSTFEVVRAKSAPAGRRGPPPPEAVLAETEPAASAGATKAAKG
jgi:hypothetical protein